MGPSAASAPAGAAPAAASKSGFRLERPFAALLGHIAAPCLLVVALVAFCSPWTELQHSGKTYYTQSGLQCGIGQATEALIVPAEVRQRLEEKEGAPSLYAPLVLGFGAALLVVLVGSLLATFLRLVGLVVRRGGRFSRFMSGPIRSLVVFAGAAGGVALLGSQLTAGFPLEQRVAWAASQADQETDAEARTAGIALINMFQVNRTNAFWAALGSASFAAVLIVLENAVLFMGWMLRKL